VDEATAYGAGMTADLAELAATYGVATDFWDWQGRHLQVGTATVRAVLAALGVRARDDAEVRTALGEARRAPWRRMLPPCIVTRAGWTPWFRVHVPHGEPIEVWVEQEDGGERRDLAQQQVWVNPRDIGATLMGEATFALPGDLPLGWHRLHAKAPSGRAACDLVVTPAWLGLPGRVAGSRQWGFSVQLYSMRSERSWGLGDLADLTDLAFPCTCASRRCLSSATCPRPIGPSWNGWPLRCGRVTATACCSTATLCGRRSGPR
jgi:4-alpha-glucanotransferase